MYLETVPQLPQQINADSGLVSELDPSFQLGAKPQVGFLEGLDSPRSLDVGCGGETEAMPDSRVFYIQIPVLYNTSTKSQSETGIGM